MASCYSTTKLLRNFICLPQNYNDVHLVVIHIPGCPQMSGSYGGRSGPAVYGKPTCAEKPLAFSFVMFIDTIRYDSCLSVLLS